MSFANFTFKRQPSQREVSREAIRTHVAAYLGAGGRITTLPAPTLRPLLESTRKPLSDDERCVRAKPIAPMYETPADPERKLSQLPDGYMSADDAAKWFGFTERWLRKKYQRKCFPEAAYLYAASHTKNRYGWVLADLLKWRHEHGL